MGVQEQYLRDAKAQARFQNAAKASFRKAVKALAPSVLAAKSAHPGKGKVDRRRRGTFLLKLMRENSEVQRHIREFSPEDKLTGNMNLIRAVALGTMRLRDAYMKLDAYSIQRFQADELGASQAPLREVLPAELLRFLPSNIVVEVDPNNRIKRVR